VRLAHATKEVTNDGSGNRTSVPVKVVAPMQSRIVDEFSLTQSLKGDRGLYVDSGEAIVMNQGSEKRLPFVSLVMSLRNEEKFLPRSLAAIEEQDYPKDRYELIAVDGGSTDRSVEILKAFPLSVSHTTLATGRNLTIPAAMNLGIRIARGEIIIKLDAHGYPSRNFVRGIAERLWEQADLGAVGGSIVQLGETRAAKANGWARTSAFGVGRGPYTAGREEGYVASVQCGGYRREVLDKVGTFDEEIGLGEDDELNWRVVKAGYRILFTPEIEFFYYARPTLRALFRQYLWYGDGRTLVLRKHPDFLRIKHLVPTAFVTVLLLSFCLAFFSLAGCYLVAGLLVAYGLGLLAASALLAREKGWRYFPRFLGSFSVMHVGYGIGFLRGCWNYWLLAKQARFPTPSQQPHELKRRPGMS
jgi:cellulose synthase/poly-beta-1,6-N-acetylglucosamine synthase-like glycosyltransferase